MQIVIVCSDQCIVKIQRVYTKRIVIDTQPEGFHVFYHKHGCGSCIALTEGVDLPNIRCKFCKVLYRRFNRQPLISELLFRRKIIV